MGVVAVAQEVQRPIQKQAQMAALEAVEGQVAVLVDRATRLALPHLKEVTEEVAPKAGVVEAELALPVQMHLLEPVETEAQEQLQ